MTLTRPITLPFNKLAGLVVVAVTLSLCLGLWIGGQMGAEAYRAQLPKEGPGRPITHGEYVYVTLGRLGFADWVAACTFQSAHKHQSWETAKANCSSKFLDRLRDQKDDAVPMSGPNSTDLDS